LKKTPAKRKNRKSGPVDHHAHYVKYRQEQLDDMPAYRDPVPVMGVMQDVVLEAHRDGLSEIAIAARSGLSLFEIRSVIDEKSSI